MVVMAQPVFPCSNAKYIPGIPRISLGEPAMPVQMPSINHLSTEDSAVIIASSAATAENSEFGSPLTRIWHHEEIWETGMSYTRRSSLELYRSHFAKRSDLSASGREKSSSSRDTRESQKSLFKQRVKVLKGKVVAGLKRVFRGADVVKMNDIAIDVDSMEEARRLVWQFRW